MIKICGLSTPDTLDAALEVGADMVGFVRFPRSPRHVDLEVGRTLSGLARGRAERVLLVVDLTDGELDAAMAAIEPDLVQLHGNETPDQVASIRRRTGRPVMKAVGIGGRDDLERLGEYATVADRLLLDAKPPPGAALPGGNGRSFDWSLLADLDPRLEVMLSGGLNPANVAEAVAQTGIRAVDVSSGVETRPGEKDPERIEAFVRAARAALARQDRTAS